MKEVAEAATKGFEQAISASREAAGNAARQFEDVSAAGKAGIEATVASNHGLLSGIEQLSSYATKATQDLINVGIQASQAILGAKNPQEAAQLQAEYFQKGWSRVLDESTKLGELSVQATNDMFGPINSQIGAVMDRWNETAALFPHKSRRARP
jgi:phasin family protein